MLCLKLKTVKKCACSFTYSLISVPISRPHSREKCYLGVSLQLITSQLQRKINVSYICIQQTGLKCTNYKDAWLSAAGHLSIDVVPPPSSLYLYSVSSPFSSSAVCVCVSPSHCEAYLFLSELQCQEN
ncbi:hypothetical protein AMECASPLE_032292 [Ameca splendens]|uniref:Uncharacterized protein n=1 Tax=Ameca splendens TaxID=208324 RepID=A0ABV0ZFM5_9TELE